MCLRRKRRQTSDVFSRLRREIDRPSADRSRPERSRLFAPSARNDRQVLRTWLRRPLFELRSKRDTRSLVKPGYGAPFLGQNQGSSGPLILGPFWPTGDGRRASRSGRVFFASQKREQAPASAPTGPRRTLAFGQSGQKGTGVAWPSRRFAALRLLPHFRGGALGSGVFGPILGPKTLAGLGLTSNSRVSRGFWLLGPFRVFG